MKANGGGINFAEASVGMHTNNTAPFFYIHSIGNGNVFLNYKNYVVISKKKKETRENIYYSLYQFLD